MIQSVFILNGNGEVIIQKHWRGNARQEDTVTFWSAMLAALQVPADVPPFIPTSKGVLVHLHRSGLFFLAAVGTDTPPLSVTDFLTILADTLLDYFGELNEHAIKDNFITVYELLDEMLDSGFAMTCESNILKQLVLPPNMLTRVIGSVTGDSTSGSTKLPFPTASPLTPWRRDGIRYAQNEIFVDVEETVDAIFSTSGSLKTTHALIHGDVKINCRLSGAPDISMSLRSTAGVDDTAIHHCVRRKAFQESGQLLFVPPDGAFNLMSYVIRDRSAIPLPVEVEQKVSFDRDEHSGSISVTLRPKFSIPQSPYANSPQDSSSSFTQNSLSATNAPASISQSTGGSMMLAQVIAASTRISSHAMSVGPSLTSSSQKNFLMEDVELCIPFNRTVTSASLSANIGTADFESSTGACRWMIGNLPRGVVPTLTGTLALKGSQDSSGLSKPSILAKFRIPGLALSGMYVDRLELGPSESYRYFKGLRCVTKSGRYEIRP